MLPTLGVSSTSVKCQHTCMVIVYTHYHASTSPILTYTVSPLTSFRTPWYARQAIGPVCLEGFHISSSLVIASVFCQVMFFSHSLARVSGQD